MRANQESKRRLTGKDGVRDSGQQEARALGDMSRASTDMHAPWP